MTRLIVDIRTRSDANTAHLRGKRIGKVVTVQVHGGDHIIVARADDGELQRDICNGVFDEQHLLPLAIAVGIPQLEGFFHFGFDLTLLCGAHHVEAGVDHLGVVFHAQAGLGFLVAKDPGLAFCHNAVTEFALGEGVTPILERAFGELHDVALVDEVHALAIVIQRPLDRGAHEAVGAFF